MQRDENLVYINNGVNGQQIDAVHMGYRYTGVVYTRRSGSVQIQPDRPPISVVSELESVLTLYSNLFPCRACMQTMTGFILLLLCSLMCAVETEDDCFRYTHTRDACAVSVLVSKHFFRYRY